MSGKSSILSEILQVEAKIKKIKHNKTNRKNRQTYEKMLQARGAFITVPSPEDPSKSITVRRNTDEFENALKRYEAKVNEFKKLLNKLLKTRQALEKQLFKEPEIQPH